MDAELGPAISDDTEIEIRFRMFESLEVKVSAGSIRQTDGNAGDKSAAVADFPV